MSAWKLGKDMLTSDAILDPVTFDDLILALKCNYAYIGETAVRTQMKEILDQRLEDVKSVILPEAKAALKMFLSSSLPL